MLMGGLDGRLGDDWKWNLQVAHSRSRLKAQNLVNVDQGRFFAAANAVINPANGQIVCAASLTNANYAGCVPVNLFGPSSITPEALDYFLTTTTNINRTTLTEVDASIAGSPFETWAGSVNMALSGEFRRIGWSVTADAVPSDRADCVGIQFSCSVANPPVKWLQTTTPSLAEVSQKVSEIAYEVGVPLAKDVSFARELNLNGAVRYTHYSTTGNVTTWKLGAIWRPTEDVTLRATRSRDIRAPNVFELFSPTSIAPTNLNDPLTGQTVAIGVATVSNPNLTPEKAKSWTAGIVLTPRFLPGFSLSIDAYRIKVDNAIVLIQGNSAAILNVCSQPGADPACNDVIVRPFPLTNRTAANVPTAVFQKFLNIASFKTEGVDVEANYRTQLADHDLALRALLSWQPKLVFDQGPFGVIDFGNVATAGTLFPASPGFKYTVIASYDVTDHFNVSWMQRGRGSMKAFAVAEGLPEKIFLNGKDRDPAITYSNVTLTYNIDGPGGGRSEFYFNVQNLFNQQPKVRYAGPNANPGLGLFGFFPPNGDDIVGRYFTVGFRSRF
jgi:outer membrane receptor protein involved in Fe transport